MFYVYVLISLKDRKLYIGRTPDLRSRIQKHLKGYVKATKNRRPVKLIYYEAYEQSPDARKREIYLKGGNGHQQLKIQLEQAFIRNQYKFL